VSVPTQELFGPVIPAPSGEAGCQRRHPGSRSWQAGAGWHPCAEPLQRETCSLGLNPAFCCEAQNPASHHKQRDEKQVKSSDVAAAVNVMNLTINQPT